MHTRGNVSICRTFECFLCCGRVSNCSSQWNNTWWGRQQLLKQVLFSEWSGGRREGAWFVSSPARVTVVRWSHTEFLSKGSPSWPRLAWESIFKCRDLDLNGWLKQSQENKSKGCFSGAEWGASSSHLLSLKNSFALKRMNSPSFCVYSLSCGDQGLRLPTPCYAKPTRA